MKKSNTRKALGMSLISLLACGVMFAGSTYAWFTDEVVASGNKIETGTLKADLEVLKGTDWVSIKENPETKIFDYDNWEPGYTSIASIKIVNEGTLGFRYQIAGRFAGQTYGPNGESLGDVIDVYYKDGAQSPANFDEVATEEANNGGNLTGDLWARVGTLNEWMAMPLGLTSGYMLPEGATYDTSAPEWHNYDGVVENGFTGTFVLHMREDAGNEYQGLSLGDVNVTLNATQWAYEKDGFDYKDYDKQVTINSETDLVAALAEGKDVELGSSVVTSDFLRLNGGTLDGNGNTINASSKATDTTALCSITTTGGTIKNVNVVGGRRGIGSGSTGQVKATEDLIIDNVVIDAVVYGINHGGNNHDLIVSNSVLNGWNSFESCGVAEFTNCQFVYGRSAYCYVRTYNNVVFKDCAFEDGFKLAGNYADWQAKGYTLDVTLENCTYNGVLVTAANFEELLLNANDDDAEVIKNANLTIN